MFGSARSSNLHELNQLAWVKAMQVFSLEIVLKFNSSLHCLAVVRTNCVYEM